MQDKKTLIDKASEICGGDAALARRMGISRALVSLMRSGDRKITPETAAELDSKLHSIWASRRDASDSAARRLAQMLFFLREAKHGHGLI